MPLLAPTDVRSSHGGTSVKSSSAFDLLAVPVLGTFLKQRWMRPVLQSILLVLAVLLILHGFLGPKLAPKNLATLLTWVHYRGLLVLALLALGNVFCMGCPLLLPRELARRFSAPVRRFPRALRNKWLGIALFAGLLFAYEAMDLWASPAWTAGLIVAYFALALLVDAFFERAAFCKYVCPIGQFNFVASTVSPFEVKVKEAATCDSCTTKDCIKGSRNEAGRIEQRGCELDLFLPRKVGNLDCTFCMDCVHACPHDNVALALRVPGEELAHDGVRSGVGRLSKRPDLAVLALLFTFGALLNAFGMVSPVYAFQEQLAQWLGTRNETAVLGVLFGLALVVEPVVLLCLAGTLALRAARSSEALLAHIAKFAYGLVPLGLGIWAAHYAFHFLTGLWTFVPVAQAAALDVGFSLGHPDWGRGGLTAPAVKPIELGLLIMGFFGSLAVTARIARREHGTAAPRALAPWAALQAMLLVCAIWLLAQPMEMRGTFL